MTDPKWFTGLPQEARETLESLVRISELFRQERDRVLGHFTEALRLLEASFWRYDGSVGDTYCVHCRRYKHDPVPHLAHSEDCPMAVLQRDSKDMLDLYEEVLQAKAGNESSSAT